MENWKKLFCIREVERSPSLYLVVTDNPSVVRVIVSVILYWCYCYWHFQSLRFYNLFSKEGNSIFEFYISPATIYFPETLLCVSLSWLSSSPIIYLGALLLIQYLCLLSSFKFFLSGLLSPLTAWLTWWLHICLRDGFPEALLHPTSCFFCPNFISACFEGQLQWACGWSKLFKYPVKSFYTKTLLSIVLYF